MFKQGGIQLIKCCISITFFRISNTNIFLLIGRAIQYRKVTEHFVAVNKDLRVFELTDDDWSAIILISQWLKSFRSTTVQMSATKNLMLSSTLAIFCGLQ